MYEITINEFIKTKGLISFTISKKDGQLVGEGVLKTHLYIDEIDTLECYNFALAGIDVYSESFGSTDPCIVYQFTFTSFDTYYELNDYTDEELDMIYGEGGDK